MVIHHSGETCQRAAVDVPPLTHRNFIFIWDFQSMFSQQGGVKFKDT